MALGNARLLAKKTAIITGGTTGIGKAIALEFLRQGCNVAVNHLGLPKDEPQLRALQQQALAITTESRKTASSYLPAVGELLELAGDITKPVTSTRLVEKAADRWGKVDICVANGIFPHSFWNESTRVQQVYKRVLSFKYTKIQI